MYSDLHTYSWPRVAPGIYGGKKAVDGEIVTPTFLCTRTCIHIHGLGWSLTPADTYSFAQNYLD